MGVSFAGRDSRSGVEGGRGRLEAESMSFCFFFSRVSSAATIRCPSVERERESLSTKD